MSSLYAHELNHGMNHDSKKGDVYLHPLNKKKFKRAQSTKIGSFKARKVKQPLEKVAVYIDWQRIYWGKLRDLIYPTNFEEFEDNDADDCIERQSICSEIRQALKAYAKQYGFKIVWRKKSSECVDKTEDFIDYWDKGSFAKEEGSRS